MLTFMLPKTFIQVGVSLYWWGGGGGGGGGGHITGRILQGFYSIYIIYILLYKSASKIENKII